MNLTTEQIKAVELGEPVAILLDTLKCVVIREDLYDRLKQSTADALSADVVYDLIDTAMADDDAQDPALQSYQKYKQ